MNPTTILGLINNAALLLALALLYDMMGIRDRGEKPSFQQGLTGIIISIVGVAIMLNPWQFAQGIVFDTRSVLLCITGFFFGTLPAVIAVVITSLFRLLMGGPGTVAGITVILASGGIGLAWRHLRSHERGAPSLSELYLLGIVVHFVMLLSMLTLPWPMAWKVLSKISLPVMLIFPVATAALGNLMVNREKRSTAEGKLQRSEEKFRKIFQDHSAVKLLIDPDTGAIVDANAAAAHFYGRPVAALIKMHIQDINVLSPEQIQEEMERARSRNINHFEFQHRLADDSIRDVEVYSSRIEIEDKTLLHSVIHDITERKKAQKELAERELFLRWIIQTTVDGFWIVNGKGQITDVNEAYCVISGYTHEEMLGFEIQDLDAVESAEETRERIQRIKRNGSEIFETSHHSKDGEIFPVEISVTYIALEGDDFFIWFCRDLRERQKREKRIQLLSEMLDIAPVLIMIHDTERHIHFTNQMAVKAHGYETESDFLSINLRNLDVPESEALLDERSHLLTEKGEAHFEVAHYRKDGSTFPIEIFAKAIEWEGQPAILSIGLDITERKMSETAIAHSHDLMRYIIEHANSGVAVHDRDLNYIFVSQHYLDIYKVKEQDVIGRHHYEVFPDLPQKWRDVHQKALAGEVSRGDRDMYPREDGTVDWTRWECRPWYEADGSIGGFIVYTEVITERVQMEEALRQSEEYQRAMIGASPLAIISLDPEGYVRSWNTAAERIFGWSEAEVLSKFLPIVPEDKQETFTNLRQNVMEGASFSQLEMQRLKKDGTFVDISLSTAPIYEKGGEITGIMAVLEDISQRIEAEKEREKLQNQLIQAQKMESVGRLAGGVAHDYNNMLSIIHGYTEMALEKLDPDEDRLRPDLEEVKAAARRSAEITRQLLAFSRQQTIDPKPLDLNDTVESMLKMVQRLIGEDIDLAWRPNQDIWPVFMDPTQLDQILVNLCVNARDAITDVGKVTIETDTKTFDESYCADHPGFIPGHFVLLSVSDNGCGMDQVTQDHLFEPFFTTKQMGKGTGLGMATVYGIVKQNNGFINVYSEPNQGTTFRIYLPSHEDTQQVSSKNLQIQPDARGNETILLVEDDPTILKMTTMILERLGYNVLQANTPGEAVKQTQNDEEIHLLMTDVVMPEMNGRELSLQIQTTYPHLKVLFMSGYTANVIAHRGVLDQGINFIQKPFSKQELSVQVRKVLDEEN